jgi:hypothetical protein
MAGADGVPELVAEPPEAGVVPEPAASAVVPKIAPMIFPKMLIYIGSPFWISISKIDYSLLSMLVQAVLGPTQS